MPLTKIALCLCFLVATPALAQEGPVSSAGAAAVDAQIKEYLDASTAALPTAGDPAARDAQAGPRDRAPHGEFGVGIGTGGYRHVHASTVVPVGDIGTAAIAVSDTRFNGRFGPRKQQSLSIGIALGDAAAQPRLQACREDRRSGPEPMWVTRLRADGQPVDALACEPHR